MKSRIVIVGGVAGGMSAATRARRMNEHASITVFEKGGFISFANCGLPYYLAGRIQTQDKLLVTTPQEVRDRFNIDARVSHEVVKIDRANHQVDVVDRASGRAFRVGYDKLILATGASPIIPPISHVQSKNVFLLRTMEDTLSVNGWLQAHPAAHSAVIVGAGFIGLEMAEAMHDRGLAVSIVEKASHVLPPLDAEMAAGVAEELTRHDVRVLTGNGLKALHVADGLIRTVETEDGQRLDADIVLLSIGVRPNLTLANDAGLTIGPSGAIAVDEFQRTNDPDIYVVGDASEAIHGVTRLPVRIPLAGPANRQGRLAGEHAATGSAPIAGKVLGTAIVKVFDQSVGMTGLNEESARKSGFAVDTAYALPKHHASYYPGARTMRIKLIYDDTSGKVLGAQIVGEEGVDKRLDVIATTVHFGGTIDDLASLDLAYAPQFGSAKDAVHIAAMVAENQRRRIMPAITFPDLDGEVVVDVRTAAEFATGALAGAINIPLNEIRGRIAELDGARATVTVCQIGQRGYVAQRFLQQHGFTNVRNLKGGMSLAKQCGAELHRSGNGMDR